MYPKLVFQRTGRGEERRIEENGLLISMTLRYVGTLKIKTSQRTGKILN